MMANARPLTVDRFLRRDPSGRSGLGTQGPGPQDRGDTPDQRQERRKTRKSSGLPEAGAVSARVSDPDDRECEFSEPDPDSDEWLPSGSSGRSRSPSPEEEMEPSSSRGPTLRAGVGTSACKAEKKGGASATLNVEWQQNGWEPNVIPFTATPGLRSAAAELKSDVPADFFELFITNELLAHITEQTNLYARQYFAALPEETVWKPVSVPELKKFFGLSFLTGLIKKPRLDKYWSVDEMISTPYFSKTMPRTRYQLIWRFLHFNDNLNQNTGDKLYKVRPVLDSILQNFREMYQPGQNICIDEGIMQWRGRLAFKVYNPQKPVKYGIKSYVLFDSATGYCFNMRPYVGEASTLPDIVFDLLDRLSGHGYTVYMDNFYNSVSVCESLLKNKTNVCGTLRKNRGETAVIRDVKKSDLGAEGKIVRHNNKVCLLAWHDKRVVKMVTTCHQDKMQMVQVWQKKKKARVPQLKPDCVVAYNLYMNGVDILDQNISYCPFMRKTLNWSKKFVMYLFQLAVFNSYILYRTVNPGKSKDLLDFIERVAKRWTTRREVAGEGGEEEGHRLRAPPCTDPEDRLDGDMGRHEMGYLTPTGKKQRPSRRCRVCTSRGQRSETKMWCKGCGVPLHPGKCYTVYHTRENFSVGD